MGSSVQRSRITGGIAFILAGVVLILFPAVQVHADEVDDILALKSKNRDKIKRFSAEYTVETTQQSTGKTGRMRYRMKMERLSVTELKGSINPWRIETEIIEPIPMRMKYEGENVTIFKDGKWVEQKVSDAMREKLHSIPEMNLGADPKEFRKRFSIKVIRRNNPIIGPKTRTIEYVSKSKSNIFEKIEEDVEDDGFVSNTRLFRSNKNIANIRSKQNELIHGIPFCTEMEALTSGPQGEVLMKTQISQIKVDLL